MRRNHSRFVLGVKEESTSSFQNAYAYNEFGLCGGQSGDQSDLSPLPSVCHTRKVGYLSDGRVNVRRVFLPRVFVEESHKS